MVVAAKHHSIAVDTDLPDGVHILDLETVCPDSDGVCAEFPLILPQHEAIIYYAAFQRHDPMGAVALRQIGGGMNRVQALRIRSWSEGIEGGLYALLKLSNGEWLALLPLTGKNSMAWLAPGDESPTVRLGTLGSESISGPFPALSWARGRDLYEVCERVWRKALQHPTLQGMARMRTAKNYPEMFQYLGWCSWEEYRRDISSEILVDAAQRLTSGSAPVRWILVDDGYYQSVDPKAQLRSHCLKRLAPDPSRFPDGWKPLLSLRSAEQIRWMGLWQNFNGYWGKISAENELGDEINSHLRPVAQGGLLPKETVSDATAWYEAMIGAARSAGFDFVKIDDQAQNLFGYQGESNPVASAVFCSQACESVAEAQMDGLINCMAHGPINTFHTKYSAVTRCSEDYLLNDEWRAKSHLHNSYQNLLWLGSTVWGDHDMFHSNDQFAGGMMALSKAMSGGPIYLSDDPSQICLENVLPLCFADGRLLRPLAPAVPLPESAAIDPFEDQLPYLVVAPLPNQAVALVAYNLTEPTRPVRGAVHPEYFHCGILDPASGNEQSPEEAVLLYEWKTQTAKPLSVPVPFVLESFSDAFFLLFPIICGWAFIGNIAKFLSPAACEVLSVTPEAIHLRNLEEAAITVWREGRLHSINLPAGKVSIAADDLNSSNLLQK